MQKKLKDARELFDKIAKGYPDDPLAAASEYYAAECTYGLAEYADCQGRLQRFVEVSPGGSHRGHAHLLLGDMLTLLAFDLDKGRREYNAVLNPEGYSPWWPKLAREAPRQEQPDKTWDEAKYGACDRLGVIAYFERKFEEAEKHFKESARLNLCRDDCGGNVPVGMELVVELVQKKKMPALLTDDILQGDRRVGFALFWASVLGEGWRYREGMAVFDRLAQHLDKAMTEDQRAYFNHDFQKFRDMQSRFRWPNVAVGGMPAKARYFSWRAKTLTDKGNLVAAHERTHRVCFRKTPARPGAPLKPGQLKDDDGDRVPDEWEQAVGLNPMDHSTYHSTSSPPFTLYIPNGARPDNEFYAWINAAFSPHYEGVVLDADGADIRDKLLKGFRVSNMTYKYYGIVPKPSIQDLDWSAGGGNWDMGSGE